MEVKLEFDNFGRTFKLAVLEMRGDKEYAYVMGKDRQITLKELKEYEAIPELFTIPFRMGSEFLQKLSDALWDKGIRPDKHKDSETLLTATKYHLEDMRKLVFKEVK